MNKFQRIKDFVFGVILILLAAALFLVPETGFYFVAALIGLMIFIYGFKLLWYYLTMTRHMVGGKTILYQSVIVLDVALFTGSVATMDNFIVLFYLLGVFAFKGIIDILRAFEEKRFGSATWKRKLIIGAIGVLFALMMLVLGVVFKNTTILVYGFAISLVYSGVTKIVTSLRKTAIIYIQ